MILDKQFDRDVIIYAFRYTLGRHSYAPSIMIQKLDEVWDQLDIHAKELILREIAEHEERYYKVIELAKEHKREYELDRLKYEKYDVDDWANWRLKRISKDTLKNGTTI